MLLVACLATCCTTADPLPDNQEVRTTLFLPSIYINEERPTKAGYEGYSDISSLDIFVFEDDGLRRLDSYTRMDRPETPYITVTSGAGDKLVVMLANCGAKSFTSAEIRTYESLESVTWSLRDENPAFPVMSGECQISAGADGYTPVLLTPLMANVRLDFVKVNFAGRGYKSRTLENSCVYLTNVSGIAEVLRQDGFRVTELQNSGALDRGYLAGMAHPEMIYRSVTPSHWTPIDLY